MPVADGHQPLADIGTGGDCHPQPIGRILMHETPIGAHEKAAFRLAQPVEIAELTPADGARRVARQLSNVVLPEPDSPTIASTSPGHSSNETFWQPMRLP
eukprot:gene9854-12088_t